MPATEFPDRLAELRRARGLTQVQLASRIEIHPSQLHRYEAGSSQPSLDVVRRLCRALSVSADALLFSEEAALDLDDRLGSSLSSAIYLPEHERAVIAEVIDAFVAAHVAKDRSNLPRGPLQKRKREGG